MSDTPKDPGTDSGEHPEYRDPTAPVWHEAESPEPTEQLPSTESPAFEPPSGAQPGPAAPPPPNPYGQSQNPYAAGAPTGYPVSQPGPPPAPGAPGTRGAGFPPGPPAAYGQQSYGQPGYGQPPGPAGQGYGPSTYAPTPYGRPRGATNTSAIVLLVVSGLSTLVGCFFAIPALVLGIMAVVKQGESPADSAKFTRWGWIAYAIAVAFVVIGGIIAIALFASNVDSTGY